MSFLWFFWGSHTYHPVFWIFGGWHDQAWKVATAQEKHPPAQHPANVKHLRRGTGTVGKTTGSFQPNVSRCPSPATSARASDRTLTCWDDGCHVATLRDSMNSWLPWYLILGTTNTYSSARIFMNITHMHTPNSWFNYVITIYIHKLMINIPARCLSNPRFQRLQCSSLIS